MKFSFETKARIDLSRLWSLYADLEQRKLWDTRLQRLTLDRGFTAGSTGEIVFEDGNPMPHSLIWVDTERGFRDETVIAGVGCVYFTLEFGKAEDGLIFVRHTLEFVSEQHDDSVADLPIATAIFADVPAAVFSIIKAAQ